MGSNGPRWAVLGATGAIGRFLLAALTVRSEQVLACSRTPQPERDNVDWLAFDLRHGLPELDVEFLVSAGPLDVFARALDLADARVRCRRVVAFSSTSAEAKRDSADAGERALAQRLRDAEVLLAHACRERGIDLVLLRPTLIYGAARDQHLSRLARIARRWHCLPLPGPCRGLRQPVHAEDLAVAVLAAALTQAQGSYVLAGGETLSFREMVRRMLATLPGSPRIFTIPASWARRAVLLWRSMRGVDAAPTLAALDRLEQDLCFDDAAARRDLGWAPRAFAPERAMFLPR